MKRFPLLDSVRFPALRLNQLPLLREIRWDNPTIEKVVKAGMCSPHLFPGGNQFA